MTKIPAKARLKAHFKSSAVDAHVLLAEMRARFEQRKKGWKNTSPLRRQMERRYAQGIAAAERAIEAARKATLDL
jgi:hypothetical protein